MQKVLKGTVDPGDPVLVWLKLVWLERFKIGEDVLMVFNLLIFL
jgi:hypothetical protein